MSYVKRYLTALFLSMSAIVLIVGLRLDFQWNGIISWGLSFVFLLLAAYYTKYIPNDKKEKNTKEKRLWCSLLSRRKRTFPLYWFYVISDKILLPPPMLCITIMAAWPPFSVSPDMRYHLLRCLPACERTGRLKSNHQTVSEIPLFIIRRHCQKRNKALRQTVLKTH